MAASASHPSMQTIGQQQDRWQVANHWRMRQWKTVPTSVSPFWQVPTIRAFIATTLPGTHRWLSILRSLPVPWQWTIRPSSAIASISCPACSMPSIMDWPLLGWSSSCAIHILRPCFGRISRWTADIVLASIICRYWFVRPRNAPTTRWISTRTWSLSRLVTWIMSRLWRISNGA